MARGRMIDKRISKSKKIANLKNDRSRVLYFMMLPHLDQAGRIVGDPEEIKEDCCPKLKYSIQKIAESIIDLANSGLLILYEDEEERPFIEYKKFECFQHGMRKDREAPSSIPSPQSVRTNSGSTPAVYLRLNLSLKKELKKEEVCFDFDKRKFLNIKDEDIIGWKEAYPACDVTAELKKMREWLLANPEKKKKNYRRFIVNWLIRTQEKGGTKKEYQISQIGKTPPSKNPKLSQRDWDRIAKHLYDKGKSEREVSKFYAKQLKIFPSIEFEWEKSDKKPETFLKLMEKSG